MTHIVLAAGEESEGQMANRGAFAAKLRDVLTARA
jgi:hypothetical protein